MKYFLLRYFDYLVVIVIALMFFGGMFILSKTQRLYAADGLLVGVITSTVGFIMVIISVVLSYMVVSIKKYQIGEKTDIDIHSVYTKSNFDQSIKMDYIDTSIEELKHPELKMSDQDFNSWLDSNIVELNDKIKRNNY